MMLKHSINIQVLMKDNIRTEKGLPLDHLKDAHYKYLKTIGKIGQQNTLK